MLESDFVGVPSVPMVMFGGTIGVLHGGSSIFPRFFKHEGFFVGNAYQQKLNRTPSFK